MLQSNQRQQFPTSRWLAATPVPKVTFNAKVSTGTFLPEPNHLRRLCPPARFWAESWWTNMWMFFGMPRSSLNSWSVRAHSFPPKNRQIGHLRGDFWLLDAYPKFMFLRHCPLELCSCADALSKAMFARPSHWHIPLDLMCSWWMAKQFKSVSQ